jgi:succinoglycan biosynthesis transport protein ExoP
LSNYATDTRALRGATPTPFRYDVVVRRKWIVILLPLIAATVTAALTLTANPVYRAESKIIVGQGGGLVQPGFANSIQPYTATMSDLIGSDIVAKNVIANLGLKMSSKDLLKEVSTSINPQTAVIDVFVDDQQQARAVAIDREIGIVFSKLVATRFGSTSHTPSTPASAATQPLTANVFDPAHLQPGQVSPHPARSIAIGFVLGLALGLIGAFVSEHFDRRLRSREDVQRAFGAPIIGQIPHLSESLEPTDGLSRLADGSSRSADAFRSLRANLHYLGIQRPLGTILVTSAGAAQGKTTVAANLAVAVARSGASVVVVDADLRRPKLNSFFSVPSDEAGLTSVLVGQIPLDDALRVLSISPAEDTNVSMLPSGPLPPNPAELMASARMLELVEELKATYEFVIFDSPPILPVADALELARLADGVVVVVRRDHASSDEARELRAALDLVGIEPLGVVITDAESPTSYGTYTEDYGHGDQSTPTPTPTPTPTAISQRRRVTDKSAARK